MSVGGWNAKLNYISQLGVWNLWRMTLYVCIYSRKITFYFGFGLVGRKSNKLYTKVEYRMGYVTVSDRQWISTGISVGQDPRRWHWIGYDPAGLL